MNQETRDREDAPPETQSSNTEDSEENLQNTDEEKSSGIQGAGTG